jgi:hypothetical protein
MAFTFSLLRAVRCFLQGHTETGAHDDGLIIAAFPKNERENDASRVLQ